MLATWVSTVLRDSVNSSATSALDSPRATSPAIVFSAGVKLAQPVFGRTLRCRACVREPRAGSAVPSRSRSAVAASEV